MKNQSSRKRPLVSSRAGSSGLVPKTGTTLELEAILDGKVKKKKKKQQTKTTAPHNHKKAKQQKQGGQIGEGWNRLHDVQHSLDRPFEARIFVGEHANGQTGARGRCGSRSDGSAQ